MSSPYRDPFVERLEQRERGEEAVFFERRDRELVRRLRQAEETADVDTLRRLVRMRCPECAARLTKRMHRGVAVSECPRGHGMWMTERQHHVLAAREHDSWLTRYLPRLHPREVD